MFGLNFNDWNTYFGLIGIVALVFSIWQYYKTKSETKLTLYIQELIPIISDSLKNFKNLQVKVIENNIPVSSEVYHLRLFLKNTGNIDIPREKIHEELKISLSPEVQILDNISEAYPANISHSTEFDNSKNEFKTTFQLLRKGELIQYDLIVHVPEGVKAEKKFKHSYQIKKFIMWNVALNGRIENCKEFEFSFIKQEPPRKTYFNSLLILIFGICFLTVMYLIILKPFYIERNKKRRITNYNEFYYGKIDFYNKDTLIITEPGISRKRIVSHDEFDKLWNVYPYEKRGFQIGPFLMIFGITLVPLILGIYIDVKKARNKKSIADFIKAIDS